MAIAEFPVATDPSHRSGRGDAVASVECLDTYTVVHLHGVLDLVTLEEESLALSQAIARDLPVVVDLAEVDFLDAGTIGVIAGSAGFLFDHARSLTVRAPTARVERLFRICGLGHLIAQTTGPSVLSVVPPERGPARRRAAGALEPLPVQLA